MESREQQVRTWSMLCHLAALTALFFPLGLVLGPLIVWQIKKNELPEIDAHGKAAVNFQLTVMIINVVAWIILLGSVGIGFFWRSPFFFIGTGFSFGFIIWLINIAALIFAVIAGLKANNGEPYRYPFSIHFIK